MVLKPKISVAITTYKRPVYLNQCLQSVYNQSVLPDEIIISDDGNDPETKAVIQSFDQSKIKIHHVVNDPPLLQFNNRVQAFKLTTGEFVAMLDDDDCWENKFLEKTMEPLLQNSEISFCSADHFIMNNDGTINPEASERASERFGRNVLAAGMHRDVFMKHITYKCFPLQFTLFRRQDLEEVGFFPEKGGMVPDFALFLELGAQRKNGFYLPQRLGAYRVHAGQQTVRRIENGVSLVEFLKEFDTTRLGVKERRKIKELYNYSSLELAISYAHMPDRFNSLKSLRNMSVQLFSMRQFQRFLILIALFAGFKKT